MRTVIDIKRRVYNLNSLFILLFYRRNAWNYKKDVMYVLIFKAVCGKIKIRFRKGVKA